MNIFDILGPIMVGPSSSHTAGAARIGYIAKELLKEKPVLAIIYLSGSFASTGIGHGTDKAIIAGLLGLLPDDTRIPNSFSYAQKAGLVFEYVEKAIKDAHPNTALLCLKGENGRKIEVQASSIGGGQIMINKLDGITVNFNSEKPTLIVHNQDQPGHVAFVTALLSKKSINIAAMQLYRNRRGGYAVMVIESDQSLPLEIVQDLERITGIIKVTYINTLNIKENH